MNKKQFLTTGIVFIATIVTTAKTTASGSGSQLGFTGFGILARGSGAYNLSGLVDEEGIWTKALSQQEITDLFNGGCGDPLGGIGCAVGLQQYKSDATTTLSEGSITTENIVEFGGKIQVATGTARLKAEVQQAGTAFTGTPNATSSGYVVSGTTAFASMQFNQNRPYHWQAREKDDRGNYSSWQQFGTSTLGIDFRVSSLINAASMAFNGVSSLTYSAASTTFSATDPFTVEFWYANHSTSTMELIDTRSTSANKGFAVYKDVNGINFSLNCDSSSSVQFYAATSSMSKTDENIWHHVAITKNSTTSINGFNFYFDGVLMTTTSTAQNSVTGNCFVSSSTDSITFGEYPVPHLIISILGISTKSEFGTPKDRVRILQHTALKR